MSDPTSPEKQSPSIDNLSSFAQNNQATAPKTEDEHKEAPLSKRLLAGFIDILIGITIVGVGYAVFPDSLHKVAWALQLGYLLTRDALPFLKGRSLGKTAAGLRAVTTDGQALTGNWEASIIRNIFFAIAPLIEIIVLVIRQNDPKRGLRLGDDFAKTKVILSEN